MDPWLDSTAGDDIRTSADTLNRGDDWTEVSALQPHERVGRYRILHPLGQGGMGVVYLALDPKLGRHVALKLLRAADDSEDPGLRSDRARLLREALALAQLSHPNVVTVYDVDIDEGRLYVAMEYIDGWDVARWLERDPTSAEILEVYRQAGSGLAAAHDTGLLHRDFKPHNVMVGRDGRVRVADFGLVRALVRQSIEPGLRRDDAGDDPLGQVFGQSRGPLTRRGKAVGTPAYMAPEQRLGLEIGPEADQFSFAASLFESLYRKLPFGDDGEEGFRRSTRGEVEPAARPEVPTRIHRALVRALAPVPEDRYASMHEFLHALDIDSNRSRMRWALAGSAFGGLGVLAAAWSFGPSTAVSCDGEEAVAEVWDDARRSILETAFEASQAPAASSAWTRVESTIDDYANRWSSSRTRVCEATHVRGEQSETLLDLRMECLDRQRSRLDALLGQLQDPRPENVLHANTALQTLDAPARCVMVTPKDMVAARSSSESLARLDRARALFDLGQYVDVLAELAPAASELAPDDSTSRARMYRLEAMARDRLGNIETAADRARQAIVMAARAGDAAQEAEAWALLIALAGVRQHRANAVPDLESAARAALERMATPGPVAYFVELNTSWAVAAEHPDEALAHALRALDLAKTHYGETHTHVSHALSAVGRLQAEAGDLASARASFERALVLDLDNLGPEHPDTAATRLNLGNIASMRGDWDEAATLFEEAARVQTMTLGQTADPTLRTRFRLGRAWAKGGRAEAAKGEWQEVFQLADDPVLAGSSRLALAELLQSEGDLAGAREQFVEAAALAESADEELHQAALQGLARLPR